MWFWGGITQLNVVVQSSYRCWCGQARSLKHKCHLASFMGEQLWPPWQASWCHYSGASWGSSPSHTSYKPSIGLHKSLNSCFKFLCDQQYLSRGWRDGAETTLGEHLSVVPSSDSRGPTTTCNSSFWGSDAIFQPPPTHPHINTKSFKIPKCLLLQSLHS